MDRNNLEINRLINNIINLEWEMFRNVKTSETNTCQENEKTFRLMRWMSYSVFPENVLTELLNSVNQATLDDRNLMTEKYARMGNQIPPINESPLINECVEIEEKMMKAVSNKYPLTFRNSNRGFGNYLKCELETYSDAALKKYHGFLVNAEKTDINIIEQRYDNLFKRLGYESLADKESKERHKEFWDKNECRGC
ncbi:MAG: DUF4125 family protein [Bacteroidetes bacterium]|nr:DUF4125 family protein [Bacteroidota bacterium]